MSLLRKNMFIACCTLNQIFKGSTPFLFIFFSFSMLHTDAEKHPVKHAMSKQNCQMTGYRLDVRVNHCLETSVDINTCLGACMSVQAPMGYNNQLTEITNCCHVAESVQLHVRLKCFDSSGRLSDYFHKVNSAVKCSCRRCS